MRKFLSLLLALAMIIACCSFAAAEAAEKAYTEQDITIDAGDHQIPATPTLPVGAEGEKVPRRHHAAWQRLHPPRGWQCL